MPQPPSIPRRFLQALLVAVFAAFLLLPAFQKATGIPPRKRLGGITNKIREFPQWAPKSWLDGSYARTMDTWIAEQIGIRGWLVNLNRQIRYSCFGQVEGAPLRKRALVLGKPPVLYENLLMTDALRPPQIPAEQMDNYAFNLARMQRLLREQGKAFLVVVAPNKALIYTNSLPAWAEGRVSDAHSDYRPFVDALRRHNVPCLDSMELFRELAPEYPGLVPAHGIHWGHHGAWVVWQRAIPLLNQQGVLPEIPVLETVELIEDKPAGMSDELRGQLNLFASPYSAPVPCLYPVAAPPPAETEGMLDVLVVGDSFGFGMVDALARSRLCRNVYYWFYMQSGKAAHPAAYDSREKRGLSSIVSIGAMPSTDENGRRMLEGKNLVLLVVTTFNIDKFSWGFDRLVNRLYGNPDDNPPLYQPGEVNLGD